MAKIGIDFGTTNSMLVAYDKQTNTFTTDNNVRGAKVTTSSTVWYHDNNVIVGTEARENINELGDVEGHHFEKSIKLKLGRVDTIDVFGKSVNTSKIAGEIFKKIKNEAVKLETDDLPIDFDEAVVTIPINFSGASRKELRKSANEAGIEIKSFIHEPFAAIIGYYFTKDNKTRSEIIKELAALNGKCMLVFDWGGGTLDITVVKVQDGKMIELGTSELTGIAGDKFDELIAEWAWEKFLDKCASNFNENELLRIKSNKWHQLLNIAERTKIELSSEDSTQFIVPRMVAGDSSTSLNIEITREIFEELITSSIETASNCITTALQAAGIEKFKIDKILLTGGTCKIPSVIEKLNELGSHKILVCKNAELVIAQGAAVISEMQWMPFLAKNIDIQLADDCYWTMFKKGLIISNTDEHGARKKETFTCVDQRNKEAKVIVTEGIEMEVYSPTSQALSNVTLGVLNVPTLSHEEFGDDIDVEGIIDKDIILTINANSKMVVGSKDDQNYSVRVSMQIHQLCFGLDFEGAI